MRLRLNTQFSWSTRSRLWVWGFGILFTLGIIAGCDKISIPRLSFEEEPQPRFPIAVNYIFDPQLLQATLRVEGCDVQYFIPSGELITKSFLEIGEKRFASVTTSPQSGQPATVSGGPIVTVQLSLVDQSFTPIGKSGEEDRYSADVHLELLATYLDQQGKPVGKTPLKYETRTRMWVPEITSSSTSCAMGQFDAEITEGGNHLAKDLVAAMIRWYQQSTPQAVTAQAFPGFPGMPGMPPPPTQPSPPSMNRGPALSFRTMLQDGNNNLILEGGEAIVLKIETTNKGAVPIGSAFVNLSGTPALLNAFTQAISLPLQTGTIQPGETTTNEIRALLPNDVKGERAELIVSVTLPDGTPVGSHKILAAVQPSPKAPVASATLPHDSTSTPPQTGKQARSPQPAPTLDPESPYYAILIGLDQYRDPWPNLQAHAQGNPQALADALQVTGIFPKSHIRILHNTRATKTDVEEAIFSWARPRMTKEAVLLVYFSGQALTHPSTGEVYLVPYEGSPKRSGKGLISLRVLQQVLGQLANKATLLFLDSPVTPTLQGGGLIGKNGSHPIKWTSGLSASKGNAFIQIRKKEHAQISEPAQMFGGLFGRANRNQDTVITIGELLQDLQGTAEITPPVSANSPIGSIPLAK